MDIEGIPNSIPRARVIELIEALGLNPREMQSLRMERDAVYVELYALQDGNRFWDGGPDKRAAAHRIVIPIADTLITPNPEPRPT